MVKARYKFLINIIIIIIIVIIITKESRVWHPYLLAARLFQPLSLITRRASRRQFFRLDSSSALFKLCVNGIRNFNLFLPFTPFVLTGKFPSLTIVLSETQDTRNNTNTIERKNVDNFVLAISVYFNTKRFCYCVCNMN